MVQFDTVKMMLPGTAIDAMLPEKMVRNTSQTPTSESKSYTLKGSVPGLKNFCYDVLKDTATIELSAKILAGDYFKGISLDTLEQTFDSVNAAADGVFKLANLGDWFNSAKVLRADVCTNVPMPSGDEKQKVLSSLASLSVAGYDRKVWPVSLSSLAQTIAFKRELKTAHLQFRQRHYDKFAELRRDKKFLKYLHENGCSQKVIQYAVNVVRAESTEVTLTGLRKMLNVQGTDFADVFNSTAKPNFDRFDKMVKSINVCQLAFFAEIEEVAKDTKRSKYERKVGQNNIYASLNGDVELIRQYLLIFNEKNVRRALRNEFAGLASNVSLNDSILDKGILSRYKDMLAAA
jgi:hypothetical protein